MSDQSPRENGQAVRSSVKRSLEAYVGSNFLPSLCCHGTPVFLSDGFQKVFCFVEDRSTELPPSECRSAAEQGRHVHRPGDWVYVYSITLFQRPLIEGLARIVRPFPAQPLLYYVRFKHETRPRLRRVFPGLFQSAPNQMLSALLDEWRSRTPLEILAEFYPDDLKPDNDNDHHHGEG